MMASLVRGASKRLLGAKYRLSSSPYEVARVMVIGSGHQIQAVATLKATYGEKYPYKEPYPYETKGFGIFRALMDSTSARMCENSKVITVEGNVGVGKRDFAKRIAKNFDLKYFDPTPGDRQFFVPDSGYDIRELNDMLPPDCQPYDLKAFFQDPKPERGVVGRLQLEWYENRFMDYAQAMTHLFSTGQGVVIVRSVFSDMVYVEAMRRMGYVTPSFVNYYNKYKDNSICELMKPHLNIYLDASVDVIKQRIKARNDPVEMNSKIMSDKYLQMLETMFKQVYLPKMREFSEVIEIDWTEVADDVDMEVICEEIQMLNLDCQDNMDPKFQDWFQMDRDTYCYYRKLYQDNKELGSFFLRPDPWECPEVMLTDDQWSVIKKVIYEHPCVKYKPGYSPELDGNTLLKL